MSVRRVGAEGLVGQPHAALAVGFHESVAKGETVALGHHRQRCGKAFAVRPGCDALLAFVQPLPIQCRQITRAPRMAGLAHVLAHLQGRYTLGWCGGLRFDGLRWCRLLRGGLRCKRLRLGLHARRRADVELAETAFLDDLVQADGDVGIAGFPVASDVVIALAHTLIVTVGISQSEQSVTSVCILGKMPMTM